MAGNTSAKGTESNERTQSGSSMVWFEIPADNLERAQRFYSRLFGWKINPFPGMGDYWHIDTGGGDDTPDGALMARKQPGQQITNYISVDSVNETITQIQLLGGSICVGKTAVPQMGYFAVCRDPEGNTFAVWERASDAK